MAEEAEDEFPKFRKSHCNGCGGERNHVLLAEHRRDWEQEVTEYATVSGDDTYELLECCGCEAVHVRRKSRCSEDWEPDTGMNVRVSYFPPKLDRHEPRWTKDMAWVLMFDDAVKALLEEVYRALGVKALRLAVIGIRALIETVMVTKLEDKGSFAGNLKALYEGGFISKLQHDHLETVLEAGHAAMHRQFNPTEDDVHALLDITENLVEALYISPNRVKAMDGKVPPRKAKASRAIGEAKE